MKKYILAMFLCFIGAVLITGTLIKPITPILFGGKTFENRSSPSQSLMIIASILLLSVLLFLLYFISKKTLFKNQSVEKFLEWFSPIAKTINKSKFIDILIPVSLMILACVLFFVQIKLIAFQYPLEYGEGSIQLTTYALMNKINPFSVENNFLYINVYGIGYHLVVLPFAAVLGNTLTVHRLVNFLCIIGTLLLVINVMRQKKNSWEITILAVLFVWLGLLFQVTPTARPDSLGTFLFMLTICVPFLNKYSSKSLFFSSLTAIFSFYTKIYFLLSVPIIASYLFLFVSKKKGLLYGIGFFIGLSISGLIVNQFLDIYFLNTLSALFFGRTTYNFFHLVRSSFKFIRDYWGLLAIGLLAVYQVINDWKRKVLILNVKHWNFPLTNINFDLILYSLIVCAMAVFLRMGWHTGTFQTYFYHLLTAFLVITILSSIQKLKILGKSVLLIAMLTLFTQSIENLRPDFSDFNAADWKKLESYVSQSDRILNSPMEVSFLIAQKKEINYSFFSFYYFLLPEKDSFFWPDPQLLQALGDEYVNSVAETIKFGGYDLIIRNANEKYGFFIGRLDENLSNETFVEKYYHPVDTISIHLPHTLEEWNLRILKPN